jgi:putative transposase
MQLRAAPRVCWQVHRLHLPAESRETRLRWRMLEWHRCHGANVSLTARHFGVARTTVYRWLVRYDGRNLDTLASRSHRPHRVRQRQWSREQTIAVERVRRQYPNWGKQKLRVLLQREGMVISESSVGRILRALNARGALPEPLRRVRRRRHSNPRPWALRMQRGFRAVNPGDLVQVDTQDVHLDGVNFKQFDFVDHVSRWGVIQLHDRATARTAATALDEALRRFPFAIRALQVDGGSEFMAEFETNCAMRGLLLYVLPPRSPKLNGRTERIHRTHQEEHLDWYDGSNAAAPVRAGFAAWEVTYNTVRPHAALGLLTPAEFLARLPFQVRAAEPDV